MRQRTAWSLCAVGVPLLVVACSPPAGPGSTPADATVDVAQVDATTMDIPLDVRMDIPLDVPLDVPGDGGPTLSVARHSSSIAVSPDGSRIYVVNADTDTVSEIDTVARRLVREIPLGTSPPVQDPVTHRYDVTVAPRALALSPRSGVLYVTGQRAGTLMVVDLALGAVTARIPLGSEPVGVVVSPDERSVFVACTQDATIVRVDAALRVVTATARTPWKPWALAWSPDASTLYASHLLGPGVSALDPTSLAVRATWSLPDVPRRPEPRYANGQSRALYDLAVRPGSGEIWVPHVLLAVGTAQGSNPALSELKFDTTVFPAFAVLRPDGTLDTRLTTGAGGLNGDFGQLGDIFCGPHAAVFTPDGHYLLTVNSSSEDLVALDATTRSEARLMHPLPGHMAEGLVLSPDGTRAYIDERNTGDVAVVRLDTAGGRISLAVDGAPIPRLSHDPMPANLRLGQRVFFTANDNLDPPDDIPITTDHWVACASCHTEGRSAAVTQRFAQGPRDTPSNAGGTLHTGFLFRVAARNTVTQYWKTIDVEQGGHFRLDISPDARLQGYMQAVADYVNLALPLPVPPRTDPVLAARGRDVFHRSDLRCATCHAGDWLTDSGQGNPTLDLAGPVLLHDVGTCNHSAGHPDVDNADFAGHPRTACAFDTPTLRGIADSAPYLHDGSAPTLREAVMHPAESLPALEALAPGDMDALVEYLRSL